MRRLVLFVLLSGASTAFAQALPFSHNRYPGEDWQDAFKRYEAEGRHSFGRRVKPKDSPNGQREPFEELDISQVPEWDSLEQLTDAFERVRDLRFLETERDPSFSRRISWLFPDDGCFARAAMARQQLEDQWGHRIAKLFSFGNLRVTTPNHPSGKVQWAWHVVAAARVAETLYVMDPAIEPHRPLTAEEWALKQVKQLKDARFSLCNSYAYTPYGACLDATIKDEDQALEDQTHYLEYEWKRIEKLDRDPERELGDFPPWLEDGSANQTYRTHFISSP